MKFRTAALVLLAVALAVPLSGCGRVKAFLNPPPKVVVEKATVAEPGAGVKGDIGSAPEGLPVWPDATVDSADAQAGSYSLVLSTDTPYADVLKGVSVGFERAGWSVTQSAEEASATALTVSKDALEGIVTVYQTEAGTSVEYLLTLPAE